MKTIRRIFLLGGLMAFPLIPGNAQAQGQIDCRMVAANVEKAIETAPDHVLTVVEDALVAAPGCVCEIVKAAIKASGADGALVQKIVFTAVKTSQQQAPVIAECAVAAAPHHADFVRAAFAEAFEDSPRTKKNQKKPVQVAAAPEPEPQPVKPTPAPVPVPVPAPSKTQRRPAPVIYSAPAVSPAPEMVAAAPLSGQEVVEIGPAYAYDPKGIIVEPEVVMVDSFDPEVPYQYPPGITFFGGPPIDMTGLYLVPPGASAPPFFEEREERITKVKSLSKTIKKSPPRPPATTRPRKPKPPIISRPMSPTGP